MSFGMPRARTWMRCQLYLPVAASAAAISGDWLPSAQPAYRSNIGRSSSDFCDLRSSCLLLCAVQYRGEEDLPHVMRLIDAELSEPYSIFTYRSGICGKHLH